MARIIPISLAIATLCAGQPTAEPAFVSGRVVDLNNVPLAEARVELRLASSVFANSGSFAVTGVDGAFRFENVAAERYNLEARRSGYINGRESFVLAAGQRLTGATIRLTPESSISGLVMNSNGDPFANARVGVYQWVFQPPARVFSRIGGANTGADGRFTIGGLRPGTYYVSAERNETLLTYYPNAVRHSAASPIILGSGGSFSNANIRMRDDPVFHVRGHVTNDAGPVSPEAIVWFYPAAPELDIRSFLRSPKLTANGEFDIDNVAPGAYLLRVQVPRDVSAEVPVLLQDRNIEDLTVTLRPGVRIVAKIAMDREQPISRPQGLGFPAVNPAFGGETGVLQEDGTFLFANAGPWMLLPLNATGLPPGTYIKSVRFGGEDITNSEHRFTSGGNLDVTISNRAAEVSGTVRDREGKALPNLLVSAWRAGPLPAGTFFRTYGGRSDANGAFRIQSLPPGDYRLVAWEEIPQLADRVPEFRSQFDGAAKAVHLTEGASETVEPALIRKAAVDEALAKLR